MKFYHSTNSEGIDGIIKYRSEDFIVEEIQENGRICKVKQVKYIKEKGMKEIEDRKIRERNDKEMEEKKEIGEKKEKEEIAENEENEIKEITEKEIIERKENKLKENEEEQPVIPERKEDTEYLQFDFEKRNTDLHQAIRIIARFLGVSNKRIGYAGIKDKQAISCQRISIWMPPVEKLINFKSRSLFLRNPEWSNEKIDLGKLRGNQFVITIRDISLEKNEIEKRTKNCFKEIEEKGIANYFGEQRFGGLREVTHLVGKALIQKDVEKAVMLYLTAVGEKEKEEIKHARTELARTKDFVQATKSFPAKQRYERSMLHHLCKYPKDFAGAFGKLPKKIRFLFTHAYQSHIFNEIINKRIEKSIGLKAIEGEPSRNGIALGLLSGYESEFSKGIIGEIEKEVMAEERVQFSDFKLKTLSECSSRGSRKEILLFPKKMKLEEIKEDELFEGKLACIISFELDKGNYATTVLKEIMKTEQEHN